MGLVRSRLPLEVDRRIAGIIGGLGAPAFLFLKTFLSRPGFDQGSVDGEMLIRQKPLSARVTENPVKESPGDVPLQKPIAVLAEDSRVPDRIHPCSDRQTSGTEGCSRVAP